MSGNNVLTPFSFWVLCLAVWSLQRRKTHNKMRLILWTSIYCKKYILLHAGTKRSDTKRAMICHDGLQFEQETIVLSCSQLDEMLRQNSIRHVYYHIIGELARVVWMKQYAKLWIKTCHLFSQTVTGDTFITITS